MERIREYETVKGYVILAKVWYGHVVFMRGMDIGSSTYRFVRKSAAWRSYTAWCMWLDTPVHHNCRCVDKQAR